MPPLILVAAGFGLLLLLVAILPRMELWAGRRFADIVYIRLRPGGGQVDVWRGKPVANVATERFDWQGTQADLFDPQGLPRDVKGAAAFLRGRMRRKVRRFPIPPILVLHAIEPARAGLKAPERQALAALGEELGPRSLVADLPQAMPERAFHELRTNGAPAA